MYFCPSTQLTTVTLGMAAEEPNAKSSTIARAERGKTHETVNQHTTKQLCILWTLYSMSLLLPLTEAI